MTMMRAAIYLFILSDLVSLFSIIAYNMDCKIPNYNYCYHLFIWQKMLSKNERLGKYQSLTCWIWWISLTFLISQAFVSKFTTHVHTAYSHFMPKISVNIWCIEPFGMVIPTLIFFYSLSLQTHNKHAHQFFWTIVWGSLSKLVWPCSNAATTNFWKWRRGWIN